MSLIRKARRAAQRTNRDTCTHPVPQRDLVDLLTRSKTSREAWHTGDKVRLRFLCAGCGQHIAAEFRNPAPNLTPELDAVDLYGRDVVQP